MLQINIRGLRKIYDLIGVSTFNRKKNRVKDTSVSEPSIDKLRKVLYNLIPGVEENKIIQAFYLSKMTVALEIENSNEEYTFLKWPEFMEFIGRLAQLKYLDAYEATQWTLSRKIGVVLDHLFKLIPNESRLDPPELREVISDSDDDY